MSNTVDMSHFEEHPNVQEADRSQASILNNIYTLSVTKYKILSSSAYMILDS